MRIPDPARQVGRPSPLRVKLLYFHGGPGFNSHPEEELLRGPLEEAGFDVAFWNEPSAQRPQGPAFRREGAFQNYLDVAERFLESEYAGAPVWLIGHSFGAQIVCYLTQRRPELVAKALFIAPGVALASVERKQFETVARDFNAHGDARHAQMANHLARYSGAFDDNTESAFNLMVQNERLLQLYWSNLDRMREFVRFLSDPGYGLDLDSFFSVRRTMFNVDPPASDIAAAALFGEKDLFVDSAVAMAILRRRYRRVSEKTFANSAHYPHIEQTDDFVHWLVDQLRDQGAQTAGKR